ncbi:MULTISPECIES: restriction endonuclease subunit S [Alphaproteobacteria]|uniref:restriction endonuclease subunit S n=1 Tax=Sphingopyxis sp. TaxID=1908224 RepID=UPI004033A94C
MSSDQGGAAADPQRHAVVPKLRFPEFQDVGGWKARELRELLSEPKKRNRDLKYGAEHVLSVSGEYGCVNQIEFLGRSYAGVTVKDYHIVKTGDVVYTKSPLKAAPYGIIKANKGANGIVSTLYAVYRPTAGTLAEYIDHYFSSSFNLNSYLQPLVKKGAKNDMKVNNSDVLTGTIYVPEKPEQQEIADCLSSLDAVIAAERDWLKALKDHRDGLMQQLFPAPGQTIPRLRFPEFRKRRAWEMRSLGTAAAVQSGATPAKANPAYWNGSIPWVSAKDMKQLFLTDTEDHISIAAVDDGARLVPAGTILILTRGMTLLKDIPISVLRREMACNQDVKALRPKIGVNGLFLAFALLASKRRLLDMVGIAGHGTGKLDTDELEAFELAFPQPPEQEQIVECLSSLDDRLTTQSEKVAKLQSHKQALMQQLFPSPREASQ